MQVLSTSEFKEMTQKQKDLDIINVLPSEAFKKAHIPGSVNIPVENTEFEHQVGSLVGDKNAPVVVYCANTDCDASPKAARRLEQAGFSKVYDFEAGLQGWKDAGFSVEGSA